MNSFYLDKAVLERMYIQENKTMKQIAEELNVSVGSIYNWCKKYEIPSRERYKGFLGKKHSAKVIEIISKTHKGKKVSNETKAKISKAHFKGGIGHKKMRADGYISIYFPEHPKANKDGYIMEHDLVMECFIGRHLKDDEIVHHKNFKRDDNRLENLELMTKFTHMAYHAKLRHEKRRIDL